MAPVGFAGGGLFRRVDWPAHGEDPFSEEDVPTFADAPSAILVVGDVEFFVEEAAGARARGALGGDDVEVLRFEDDAPAEAVSDALLNRSLFSPRRLVELDISRLLGTESPGRLVTKALEAWEKGGAGGRREAFRHARALLAALDLPRGRGPGRERRGGARKRVRKKDEAPALAEILKELPEEKSGGPAVLKGALRVLLERGKRRDGGAADGGRAAGGRGPAPGDRRRGAWCSRRRSARTRGPRCGGWPRRSRRSARSRSIRRAIERLADADGRGRRARSPRSSASCSSGRARAAGSARRTSGRTSRTKPRRTSTGSSTRSGGGTRGTRSRGSSGSSRAGTCGGRPRRREDRGDLAHPVLRDDHGEVRRMLLLRARLDEAGPGGFDASMSYADLPGPRAAPAAGAGGSLRALAVRRAARRPPHPFALYKAAQRASRFSPPELARALARAADVDVGLKNSAPVAGDALGATWAS